MAKIKPSRKAIIPIFILFIIVLIFSGLVVYQKGAAKSYLISQGCEAGTSSSAGCSNTCITYNRALLGLEIKYEYQPFACRGQLNEGAAVCPPADTYSGKIISLPGMHFVFDTKSISDLVACAQ